MTRRPQRSAEAEQYRHLYDLTAWRGRKQKDGTYRGGIRELVLRRDDWRCQWCRTLLTGKHPAPNSAAVHHKKDHKGDQALFLDPDNQEAICKACHDGPAQAGMDYSSAIGEDGWPLDPRHAANQPR